MVYCKALSWILLQSHLLEYPDAPYIHKHSQLWVQKVARRDLFSFCQIKKNCFLEISAPPSVVQTAVGAQMGFLAQPGLSCTSPLDAAGDSSAVPSDLWESTDKGLGWEARIVLDWAPCVTASGGEENKLEQGAADNPRRVKVVFPNGASARQGEGRAAGAGERLTLSWDCPQDVPGES